MKAAAHGRRGRLTSLLCMLSLMAALEVPWAVADEAASPVRAGSSLLLTPDVISVEDGRTVEVERGLLVVPENRRDPASRPITVHFVRYPAAAPAGEGAFPVFLLAGGPGWGLDLSNAMTMDEIELLRATRDVIYVSQRGYDGAPQGLVPALSVRYPAYPVERYVPSAEREARNREVLRQSIEQWRGRGVDLAGYDILNITDDLNDLRQALGYEKIALRGCSFGSQWSLAYLKRWPGYVDRAMLSGVEPLDFAYDSPQWLWASMTRVAQAAAADEDLGPQLPEGGLMQALQTVITRLEDQGPIAVPINWIPGAEDIPIEVGVDDLREQLGRLRLNQGSARRNLAHWPRFILEMYHGDYRFLAARAAWFRQWQRAESLINPLIDNSLDISDARDARLSAEPAARWLGDINLNSHVTRDGTPTPDVGDEFRADQTIEVPVLLVQGDYDWSTPFENATHLQRHLRQGHLVRVRGGRHCTESNKGELPDQYPEETALLYGFFSAQWEDGDARSYFETLPEEVVLKPIDFALLTERALYDEWVEEED